MAETENLHQNDVLLALSDGMRGRFRLMKEDEWRALWMRVSVDAPLTRFYEGLP